MGDGPALLLGDIGATNARLMLWRGGPGPVANRLVAELPDLAAAIRAALAAAGDPPIAGAAFGVAGPVEDGVCRMTNSGWVIDAAAIAAAFAIPHVRVVNDFAALAHAMPHLLPSELHAIGGGCAVPDAPVLVVGPGSGLGVATLVPLPAGPIVLSGEGGHGTLAGADAREDAVLALLRARFGHASAERALSGPGLEALHAAVAALDGAAVPARSAAEVTAAGLAGSCPVAREALDLFCALLGGFAGNLALAVGARGGVRIGGGIPPRILGHLEASRFRARFEAKGRFCDWLAAVPTEVVLRPDAAFPGLAALAAGAG
jgi:glucokinase